MLERLQGTWEGDGRGEYPTIEDFTYHETVTLARLPGKPILAYTQRTRSPDGRPLHAESGYYRFGEHGRVELVIAQPTGIAEVHSGVVADGRISFRQTGLISTVTAVEVTEVRRTIEIRDDVLSYTLDMAAVGQPMTFHLEAHLQRTA
jgi:hypothetical protein